MGSLIPEELPHQAEVDHYGNQQRKGEGCLRTEQQTCDTSQTMRATHPPYFTSGTVTELSAMLVDRMTCEAPQI